MRGSDETQLCPAKRKMMSSGRKWMVRWRHSGWRMQVKFLRKALREALQILSMPFGAVRA
jgi:hypothetical protein